VTTIATSRASFAAGVAQDGVSASLLSSNSRTPYFGHYLMGSHLVDYLARHYGEAALWRVMEEQSDAILFPLAMNSEFRAAFGRSLSTLIDDFAEETKPRVPERHRPAGQRRVEELGQWATIARSGSGHTAVIAQSFDEPVRLRVIGPDGSELVSRRLTDLVVGRRLVAPQTPFVSGLSLSPDGQHLYFVIVDQGAIFSEARLMHLDVREDSLEVLEQDIGGSGGSISPDGSRYYLARPGPNTYSIYAYDLRRQTFEAITRSERRLYQLNPMVSPDGQRLLVTEASGTGVGLAIYDARTGQRLKGVASPEGMAFQASWVDDRRVVYSGSGGRWMQAVEADLDTGTHRVLTDAPYLVSQPFVAQGKLGFLNRQGWIWTLDETPYAAPPADVTTPAAVIPPADAPPATEAPPPAEASPPADAPDSIRPTTASRAPEQPKLAAPLQPIGDEPWRTQAYRDRQTPVDRDVNVISEGDYSAFDHLFVPQLWGPLISSRDGSLALGLAVSGGDRLGYNRWGVGAAWDLDAKLPSGSVAYLNTSLAPWYISANVAHTGYAERDGEDDAYDVPEGTSVLVRETSGSLLGSRAWYGGGFGGAASGTGTVASFGMRYDDADYALEDTDQHFVQHRFTGPVVSFTHVSAESTPYSGRRLALGVATTGAFFPEQFSDADFYLFDVRGELEVTLPLPLSRRHTLTVSGTGRALLGAPDDVYLLQLGGGGSEIVPTDALDDPSPEKQLSAGYLPPGLRFNEELRGFEDLPLFAHRALITEAGYTYPIILDRGSATSLYFLPAIMLRQIDIDLFYSGAHLLENGREAAHAVGGALVFHLNVWNFPPALVYQLTRRLSYDEAWATFFTVKADL